MALSGNGGAGWVVNGFGIEADQSSGYTMLCWLRVPTNTSTAGFLWGGAVGVHTGLYALGAPPGSYVCDDDDNAGNDSYTTVTAASITSWTPVLFSKSGQGSGTLYAGPGPATANRAPPVLGAQTLTDLYIGQEEHSTIDFMLPTQAIAECAIWSGPLGATEIGQLLAGECPLNVATSNILCYFPLKSDLQDYGPAGLSFSGPSPVFIDHPPVADYTQVIQRDGSLIYAPAITGSLTATSGASTLVTTGGPGIVGALNATSGASTLVATGTVTQPSSFTGSLTATSGASTLVATALVGNLPSSTDTSVISINAIAPEVVSTAFTVSGSYALYPTLLFAQDASTNFTPIPAPTAPLGFADFTFRHPGMSAGSHVLVVTDTITSDTGTAPYIVDQYGTASLAPQFPPSGPALTSIIPAYAYQQYADDQDIQAFFGAYNATAQTYLDWFNSIQLPIYTGSLIAGPLLDWVAQGIYGIARPALSTGSTSAIGAFNTYELDTVPFDTVQTSTAFTNFTVTDDIFKRIITWNFYKGDGKVFSPRWLKRRVARFLAGVAGTDYTGPTYQISVAFPAPNQLTLTVTTGPLDTSLAPILQAGILSGVLPLPFRYAVSVVVP